MRGIPERGRVVEEKDGPTRRGISKERNRLNRNIRGLSAGLLSPRRLLRREFPTSHEPGRHLLSQREDLPPLERPGDVQGTESSSKLEIC